MEQPEDHPSCTICMCDVQPYQTSCHTLECGHKFHTACILQWYRSGHSTCPNCRSDEFSHLDWSTALTRAKILKRHAKRADAPDHLKKMLCKITRCNDRKRKHWKALREFRHKYKAILKENRKLQQAHWRSCNREDALLYQMGQMDAAGVVVPVIQARRRFYYDSD